MVALERIAIIILRASQLGFAVIVAAILGAQLVRAGPGAGSMARLIYTEVVASIAFFLSLIWLLPLSSTFTHWPVDMFISVLWWAALGLLINLVGTSCGAVFDWQNVSPRGDQCGKFKANIAFAFLSAVIWLASAAMGVFWVRRHRRRDAAAKSRV